MKKDTAYKGWDQPYPLLRSGAPCTTISSLSCILQLILGISVLALTPALSCSKTDSGQSPETNEKDRKTKTFSLAVDTGMETTLIKTLDILVFGTDSLQRLEAYQRFESPLTEKIYLASTAGDKQIFACANSQFESGDWMKVHSVAGLADFTYELESESREHPVMSGQASISAGGDSSAVISLKQLTSEIMLNSINCDFSGKPYEGEKIKDGRIYLINVNTRGKVFDDSDRNPSKLANVGILNESDICKFAEPALVMQDLPSEIGEDILFPDIHLRCCPNHGAEEGLGSPYTRLVIEGKVQGETYYWAETVNRNGDGNGITGAGKYVYNLTIRRKGSRDPDCPASISETEFTFSEKKWEEQEPYIVSF